MSSVVLATTLLHLRHCEERKRRSNPERHLSLDCFAPLGGARNDEPFSRRGCAPELWEATFT
jgi:hypothetical protein